MYGILGLWYAWFMFFAWGLAQANDKVKYYEHRWIFENDHLLTTLLLGGYTKSPLADMIQIGVWTGVHVFVFLMVVVGPAMWIASHDNDKPPYVLGDASRKLNPGRFKDEPGKPNHVKEDTSVEGLKRKREYEAGAAYVAASKAVEIKAETEKSSSA